MTEEIYTTGLATQPIGIFSSSPSNSKYHFVDLTPETIREILRYGPKFVEAGAGTGHDAALLEQHGADVRCYDAALPDQDGNKYFYKTEHLQHPVRKNDPDDHSYTNQEDRTLLLIWPPIKEPMAEEVLKAYNGKWFVYIGEERNGANAEANFFDLLEQEYFEVDRVPTNTTGGEQIAVFIHRRKRPPEKSERRTEEISASVSRTVNAEAEEHDLPAAEELASKIAVAAIIAAAKHAGANSRQTMENIRRDTHIGALENLPHE